MIWRPFMPSAASTPISRVRSKTAINWMLRMPMLATMITISPMTVVKASLVVSVSLTSGCNESQVSISIAGQHRHQRRHDLGLLAHLLQVDGHLGDLIAQVVEILGLVQGHKDRALFQLAHAQIVDADDGHGALAHLFVLAASQHVDPVAHAQFEQIGQPAANEDGIALARAQIAAFDHVGGLNADGPLRSPARPR